MIANLLYQTLLVLLIFTIIGLFILSAAIRFQSAKMDLINQDLSKIKKAHLTFNLFANGLIIVWFICLALFFLYTLITEWRPL